MKIQQVATGQSYLEVVGVVGEDLVRSGEVGALVQLAARAAPARALPSDHPLRLLLRQLHLLSRLAFQPRRPARFFRRAGLLVLFFPGTQACRDKGCGGAGAGGLDSPRRCPFLLLPPGDGEEDKAATEVSRTDTDLAPAAAVDAALTPRSSSIFLYSAFSLAYPLVLAWARNLVRPVIIKPSNGLTWPMY
jgi:hypothetical protein